MTCHVHSNGDVGDFYRQPENYGQCTEQYANHLTVGHRKVIGMKAQPHCAEFSGGGHRLLLVCKYQELVAEAVGAVLVMVWKFCEMSNSTTFT
jgi:hypothetical protein